MTVSITCPNCGNIVVLNIEPPIEGGFSESCRNCGALISGSYSWNGNIPRFYCIRSCGGFKKR